MIRGRCPICGTPYQGASLAELPSFPFCSPRCRLIDLGRWADGSYTIPGAEAPSPDRPGEADADEDE